ncbi:MAG: methylmalonyl Co-A mutase-associated GTPase MeaB [Pseudomonadota bacterium]
MTVDIGRLRDGVLAGNRASLSRAITLVESTRADHRAQANDLLERVRPAAGKAYRIGVSGVPGVGKSTFLDVFGTMLAAHGHKLAVLAIDPSSTQVGGSILADKTRMPGLAACNEAYIRPTPSRGALGGVARATREAITLAEAAGFDLVFVETVGVGQSEAIVADLVDLFLLLVLPGAGDEFQSMKKGVLEVADIFAVTKADGDNLGRAREAARVLGSALRLLTSADRSGPPPVHLISAVANTGLEALWEDCTRFLETANADGSFSRRRRNQLLKAFEAQLDQCLRDALTRDETLQGLISSSREAVAGARLSPEKAAGQIVDAFLSSRRSE